MRISQNITRLLLSLTLVLLLLAVPQFLTAAPSNKDVLFVLTPKFAGPPPVIGFGPFEQANIYIYKSGDAHAKSKGSINQKAGIATQKGGWQYVFEGDYDSSKKELNGKMRLSLKTTDWNSDGSEYSSLRRDFTGNLRAIIADDSTFKGTAIGTETSVQTFPEANIPTEKSSNNHTWTFTAITEEPAEVEEENAEEPPADDEISDLDKEMLAKYGKSDSGAKFSGVTGQVEIHYPGEPEDKWHLVDLDTAIPAGAQIKTDEDSSVIIGFANMSTFVLKPGSHIVVTTPPEKDSKLKLVAGNIWANIKSMLKNGHMEVEMNQAVAGIKGTTFILEETGFSSTLKVIEGAVEFKSKSVEGIARVEAGDGVAATKTGFEDVNFDAEKENAEWKEFAANIEKRNSSTIALAAVAVGVLLASIVAFKFFSNRKKET